MSETTRVNMEWPKELKEQVRERVGARGLTKFALDAVRAKLSGVDVDAKEFNEARDLAQRLADLFVRQSDYEDPVEQLTELQLPSWIDTTGWPDALAKLVPVEVAESPESHDGDHEQAKDQAQTFSDDDEDDDLHRPMFMTGRSSSSSAVAMTSTPTAPATAPAAEAPPLPHDQGAKDNLFDRLAAGGVLKRASDLKKPEPAAEPEPATAEPEPATEPAPELEVQPEPPTPVAAQPEPVLNACPKCGSEMVGDECWECM